MDHSSFGTLLFWYSSFLVLFFFRLSFALSLDFLESTLLFKLLNFLLHCPAANWTLEASWKKERGRERERERRERDVQRWEVSSGIRLRRGREQCLKTWNQVMTVGNEEEEEREREGERKNGFGATSFAKTFLSLPSRRTFVTIQTKREKKHYKSEKKGKMRGGERGNERIRKLGFANGWHASFFCYFVLLLVLDTSLPLSLFSLFFFFLFLSSVSMIFCFLSLCSFHHSLHTTLSSVWNLGSFLSDQKISGSLLSIFSFFLSPFPSLSYPSLRWEENHWLRKSVDFSFPKRFFFPIRFPFIIFSAPKLIFPLFFSSFSFLHHHLLLSLLTSSFFK